MANGTSLSGQPEHLPHDRGTAERWNRQLLSAHLKEEIEQGKMTASDFDEWLTKPWMALPFLKGFVSPKEESARTHPLPAPSIPGPSGHLTPNVSYLMDIAPGDVLLTLHGWSEQAALGEKERLDWEKAHPAEVARAREVITTLHTMLSQSLETYEKTEQYTHAAKGLNAVENILRGTKEYVWDEFWDHPEMSAGLVILTYFAYRKLKGTKLGTLILGGAGVAVAGAFLKNKFGIEPVESMADLAERMGQDGIAKGIRTARDTISRGFFGPEGEKTINGYFYEKLGFHRQNERAAFDFLLYQNPKEFLRWYDAAIQWKLPGQEPRGKSVPPEVRKLVQEIRGRHVPEYFSRLSAADRASVLIDVAHTVFQRIAEQNGKPRSAGEGRAILKKKYVDGGYFDELWENDKVFFGDLHDRFTHPAVREQIRILQTAYGDFYKGMERRVQLGSDVFQFMHVLTLETSDKEFKDLLSYEGAGLTLGDIGTGIDRAWETTKKGLMFLGKEGEEALRALEKFVSKTVPDYWTNTAWPKLQPYLEAGSDKAVEVFDLLFKGRGGVVSMMADGTIEYAIPSRFEEALEAAKKAGQDTVTFIVDSRIAGLLKEIGIQAGEAIEMTLEEAEELMKWLREQNELRASARSFSAKWEAATSQIDMRIDAPQPGYQYDIEMRVLISHPVTGNTTQVVALPTRTAINANPLAISHLPALPPGSKAIQAECRLTVTSPGGNKSEARRQITFP